MWNNEFPLLFTYFLFNQFNKYNNKLLNMMSTKTCEMEIFYAFQSTVEMKRMIYCMRQTGAQLLENV